MTLPLKDPGKVAPYGIYVVNDNTGFVNLGTDHDTAEFASESILRGWEAVRKNTFPMQKNRTLLQTAVEAMA